jgi:UDP-N-acetylmuramoylalanine--D-glutamate ligase
MKNLKNKKIALLGLGIENLAFARYLIKNEIKCSLMICDPQKNEILEIRMKLIKGNDITQIYTNFGDNYDENLSQYDIIVRSPGYPLYSNNIINLKNSSTFITTAMHYFFNLCPSEHIIGVTGTKGKGTTASLIFNILKTAKKDVFLGGNIGVAPFDFIDKITKNSIIVLELSSFQLENMKISPEIAVITNLYQEHLRPADHLNPNYHKTLKKYWQAKLNIVKYQTSENLAVINEEIKSQDINIETKAEIVFSKKSGLKSNLLGEHNKKNIDAARIVAEKLNISENDIEKGVKTFKSLPHRIEFIKEREGVKYFDDSFATTPEASIVALESFNDPIILLASGADKGANFDNFAKKIKEKVKFLVLFSGEALENIESSLEKVNFPQNNIVVVNSMSKAIQMARKNAKNGDIVLLSTACASFGLFKNYKERGNLFKEEVKKVFK